MIAIALALTCLGGPSSAASRLALVIGNGSYEEVAPLRNPTNDARAVAERLSGFGFELIGPDGEISGEPVLDLGRRQFHRTVEAFAEAVRDAGEVEIAFVYYAGHGMQDGHRSYLLPIDVAGDDVRLALRESMPLDAVLRPLDGHAALTVAVFDACREIEELESSIERVTRSGSSAGSGFRGLARPQAAGRSRLVAFAGAAGQLVADGAGGHSPYTEVLLETLDGADRMPVEYVFQDAAYRFGQRHEGQDPELLTQGVEPNRFFLGGVGEAERRESAMPVQELVLADDDDLEILLWSTAEREGTELAYRAYLERFPDGAFAAIARDLLVRLSAPGTSPSPAADPRRALEVGRDEPFDLAAVADDLPAVRALLCTRREDPESVDASALKREAGALFSGLYQHRNNADPHEGWSLYLDAFEHCSTSALLDVANKLLRKKACDVAIDYARLAAERGYAAAPRLVSQIERKPARACRG